MKTFTAALLAATATATCSMFKATQCDQPTYWWYVATGSYAGCMKILDCASKIDPVKVAEDEERRNPTVVVEEEALNLFGAIRKSRTADNCGEQYTVGSYKYEQCVKSFVLQNLWEIEIDQDSQFKRSCVVNCAYETAGAAYLNLEYYNFMCGEWCSNFENECYTTCAASMPAAGLYQ